MIYLISQLWPMMVISAVIGGVVGWRVAAGCREKA